MLKLVIGNYNYSSWSLRAWLYLRESQVPFECIRVPLFTPTWETDIRKYSPAGRVPVLIDDGVSVWDSLAIIHHVHDHHKESLGWPGDPEAEALARSISFEMHSGFLAVRDELPQNIRRSTRLEPNFLSDSCQQQVARIISIWDECRKRFGRNGPWLFGRIGIADIMFAPVALRFKTYGIAIPGAAAEYCHALEQLESINEWRALAAAESESFDFIDQLTPREESPLTPG